MSSVRLVKFARFLDDKDILVLAGIEGVYYFKFHYKGKYNPKLAA